MGLKPFFSAVEIVAEKNRPTYDGLVQKYGLLRETSWMVGNSPRSDINPALAAGLNAIFIPHADTWILEHEELDPKLGSGKLLELKAFGELQSHF